MSVTTNPKISRTFGLFIKIYSYQVSMSVSSKTQGASFPRKLRSQQDNMKTNQNALGMFAIALFSKIDKSYEVPNALKLVAVVQNRILTPPLCMKWRDLAIPTPPRPNKNAKCNFFIICFRPGWGRAKNRGDNWNSITNFPGEESARRRDLFGPGPSPHLVPHDSDGRI